MRQFVGKKFLTDLCRYEVQVPVVQCFVELDDEGGVDE